MANYSILALPAYYALTLFPHAYGLSIAKAANNNKWDNANPRSTKLAATLATSIPSATYACYERSESAHKNGMENLPLVVGAVVLGNMAQLDTTFLNSIMGAYLLSRVLYTALYINIERNSISMTRSLVWFSGVSMLMTVIVKAGLVFARK